MNNPPAIDNVCIHGAFMLYSACYRIKTFHPYFFVLVWHYASNLFTILMVKWSHTYDAPLPIYPVASTNGSSISAFSSYNIIQIFFSQVLLNSSCHLIHSWKSQFVTNQIIIIKRKINCFFLFVPSFIINTNLIS